MKRLTGILLLLCLAAPFLTSVSWYHLKRSPLRKEIKWRLARGINNQDLCLIRLANHEADLRLHWIDAHEFEYSGRMFDVVRREHQKDSTLFYCLNDHEETLLNKQANTLLAKAMGADPSKREQQRRLTDFFKMLYQAPVTERDKNILRLKTKALPSFAENMISLFEPQPLSPPPEIT